MKNLFFVIMVLAFTAVNGDQRFETVGGFCHFVLNANNDDNEVFFANCENSITQNNDGTGDGSTIIKVHYPSGAEPITETLAFTGDGTGIPCVMVDSNGTTYLTNDWDSTYTYAQSRDGKKVKHTASVTYELICRNGQQQ